MSQKNITRFANQTEYDTAFDTLSFPNVSYIDEGDEVRYMEEHPYLITGKSTATEPFTLKINNTNRTVTLKDGGDWELNVKSYLPLTRFNEFASDKSTITELKFPNTLDTSNVVFMSRMFYGCSSLTSLDLSHFNTQTVTNMSLMFYRCPSLTSLDLSHFNTQTVTNMSGMFGYCSSLQSLDLSHFNTENVTDMSSMFYGCSNLTTLDVSHFNTSKVTSMGDMFRDCRNLQTIKMCGIGNGTDYVNMQNYSPFDKCTSLTTIPTCGPIHNTVSFNFCPLTIDSAKVILNALSTPYSGAQTLAFSTATKKLINADPEALALVEQKRSIGWTISL